MCDLGRDQCFKLEFPKESEHDLEEVFENCLTVSSFTVQYDDLTHGENSLRILVRIQKEKNQSIAVALQSMRVPVQLANIFRSFF